MSVAFDTSAEADNAGGGLSTISVSATAAGADGLALIFLNVRSSNNNPTSVTVNGSATGVTLIGRQSVLDSGNKLHAYYLFNPPSSSVSYVANFAGVETASIVVQLYKNATYDTFNSGNNGGLGHRK